MSYTIHTWGEITFHCLTLGPFELHYQQRTKKEKAEHPYPMVPSYKRWVTYGTVSNRLSCGGLTASVSRPTTFEDLRNEMIETLRDCGLSEEEIFKDLDSSEYGRQVER